MTRHILMPQSDGGHVCERCGKIFSSHATKAFMMRIPCLETPDTRPAVTWEYKDVHTYLVAEWAYMMTRNEDA